MSYYYSYPYGLPVVPAGTVTTWSSAVGFGCAVREQQVDGTVCDHFANLNILLNLSRTNHRSSEMERWRRFYEEIHPRMMRTWRRAQTPSVIAGYKRLDAPWKPYLLYAVHDPQLTDRRKAMVPLALSSWNCIYPLEDVIWQPSREEEQGEERV